VAAPPDQVRLLERAIGYALGSVAGVAPRLLSRPTPCPDWDLRALLQHVNDSLAALYEAAATGRIGPDPAAGHRGHPSSAVRGPGRRVTDGQHQRPPRRLPRPPPRPVADELRFLTAS
jgi:Mycothiol maleylpyruvate isomerase N-terminal domain